MLLQFMATRPRRKGKRPWKDLKQGNAISLCEPEENDFIKDIMKDNPFPQTDRPMNAAEKKE